MDWMKFLRNEYITSCRHAAALHLDRVLFARGYQD